jgi:glucuronokinase
MICIILVAGHGALLEQEISAQSAGSYSHLVGVPKALLPASTDQYGDTILDCWWTALKRSEPPPLDRQQFREVYLVTNAAKFKYYERWASAHEFPFQNIINDGSTTPDNSLGAIADLDLAIRSKNIEDDVMVVSGDMLFSHNFDVGQVLDFFKLRKGDLAIYYELGEGEDPRKRGIVEVDHTTGRIANFLEKPESHETESRLASPVFYCFRRSSLQFLITYSETVPDRKHSALGHFMSWLVQQTTVYGMKLPSTFQLIGQVGLEEYRRGVQWFEESQLTSRTKAEPITYRCYARVGLIGNPSDGFYGKTISFTISNFWAEVTITESSRLKLNLHPLNDPTEFGSLSDLYLVSRKEGYLGGLRLLQATCKKFYQYCAQHGIALGRRNFALQYDTNIPRQVGLAGSSAIITATMKCLLKFFNLSASDMPKPLQPNFVLDVEASELFIQAGLQDRVIQVYEGVVYMDFSKSLMESQRHGNYEYLPADKLPPLWLAYLSDPSDSGKIHSNIKQRWLQKDKEVLEAMDHFAELTDKAKDAIMKQDYKRLSALLDDNFDTRRYI